MCCPELVGTAFLYLRLPYPSKEDAVTILVYVSLDDHRLVAYIWHVILLEDALLHLAHPRHICEALLFFHAVDGGSVFILS